MTTLETYPTRFIQGYPAAPLTPVCYSVSVTGEHQNQGNEQRQDREHLRLSPQKETDERDHTAPGDHAEARRLLAGNEARGEIAD